MIWTPTPEPHHGEMRVRRHFAWFPITLCTGDRLWLERYYATEQYHRPMGEWHDPDERGWRVISCTTFDPSVFNAAHSRWMKDV